ncbi:MAG: ykoH, partial [Ilumatobacteraceae bacterium]|nr:ykoH [Ilumatobacteraceae bacterium]
LQRRRRRSLDEYEQALAELETDIADLIHLSDQLLDLGTGRDGPERTDAAAVVRNLPLARLGVVVQVDDRETFVTVPAAQIRQIVNNLVANAHVHGEPPIELRVRSQGDVVVLSISDGGTGMSADFVRTAVERFTRADDAAARSGSGLGLAIVEAIVSRHGGELRLCSGDDHYAVRSVLSFECEHPAAGFTSTVGFRAAQSR